VNVREDVLKHSNFGFGLNSPWWRSVLFERSCYQHFVKFEEYKIERVAVLISSKKFE